MTPDLRRLALRVLAETDDLVLATIRPDGWPQATVVSYVSDGFDISFVVGRDSQKARNIAANPKVSAAIGGFTKDWSRIQGLSLGGTATLSIDEADFQRVYAQMAKKFPQAAAMGTPDAGLAAVIAIRPTVLSILDYTKGFGHTDLVTLQP